MIFRSLYFRSKIKQFLLANKISKHYISMQKNNRSRSAITAIAIVLALTALLAYLCLYRLPLFSQSGPTQSFRSLFTTNTTRLSLVTTYCTSTPAGISQSDRQTNQMYNSSLSTFLKANATALVNHLFNSRTSDMLVQLQVNGAGTFVFVSPYLIALVLLLLASPFFLCCCLCQKSCPVQCCRDKSPYYSSAELTWPLVVLIITAVLITVTAIPALTNASPYFKEFNCQAAQFLDNFYNGNQTSSKMHFFSGLTTIRHQFSNVLSPALTGVNTQITRLTGAPADAVDTAKTNAASAKTSMQTMPNGGNTLQYSFIYNYPLQAAASTGTLPGVVGAAVGTFGASSTLLGDVYSYVNTLEANLSTITTAASSVVPHLTAADMGARITATDAILAQVQSSLDGMKTRIQSGLSLLTKTDEYNTQYSLALYGVTMGVAVLTLVAIIFLKCFNMIGCRFLLYFLCLACFFLGIILFLFAIALSASMSGIYYSCLYFQNSFSTPAGFSNMINNVVGSQYSDLGTYFSQCFGGTNDFLTVTDATLSNYVSNLKTSVFNSALYNFTDMTTNINTKLTALQTKINDIGLGHIPDFDPTTTNGQSQISSFNSIASKSVFSVSCPSASFNIFYQDAWVPGHSTTYQNLVGCQGRVTQDATTCSSGIASTATCPSSRCMDSFSIISWYYRGGTIANMVPNANTRYGTCTPFNDYLTNFHTNYVKQVNDRIGDTAQDSANSAKLAGRYVINTKTPVNTLSTQMTSNVQPLFNEVYSNLTTTLALDSVFNPTTGVITGLDCRLLGEDGVNMKEEFCVGSFNKIFFNLVVVGIMAFAMFLMVCCILCVSVRHYQHYLHSQGQSFGDKEFRGGRRRIAPLDQTNAAIKMME